MLEKCVIRSRSRISRRNGHWTLQVAPMIMCMFSKITEKLMKQECIPVGCVLPACWPYHPLVDHIPACIARGVPAGGVYLPSGVYLPGGVTAWVVYLPGGVPAQGGVPARVVYLLQGVPARGVYLPRGCTCQGEGVYLLGVYLPRGCTCPALYLGRYPPPLWTEWLSDRCKNINFANLFCGR